MIPSVSDLEAYFIVSPYGLISGYRPTDSDPDSDRDPDQPSPVG